MFKYRITTFYQCSCHKQILKYIAAAEILGAPINTGWNLHFSLARNPNILLHFLTEKLYRLIIHLWVLLILFEMTLLFPHTSSDESTVPGSVSTWQVMQSRISCSVVMWQHIKNTTLCLAVVYWSDGGSCTLFFGTVCLDACSSNLSNHAINCAIVSSRALSLAQHTLVPLLQHPQELIKLRKISYSKVMPLFYTKSTCSLPNWDKYLCNASCSYIKGYALSTKTLKS